MAMDNNVSLTLCLQILDDNLDVTDLTMAN